ncbi:MAG: DUF5723 family protein [Flavobacteriaceae bacterium]|nr:DUF5723 family protein [Flavobacteriaceae bacterium]
MRKLLRFILTMFSALIFAQNKPILYNFDQLPQTLLLNPGEKVSQKWHAGIPLLSGFSTQVGSSKVTIYDIFADDGTTFNDKVRNVIYDLSSKDFVSITQQEEFLNGGFRLRNQRDFISFGLYQEFDAIAYYPKDLAILFYEGNSTLDKRYGLKQVNLKAELLGGLYVGISRKIDDDLQIGARFKIYSGMFNLQTRQNKGVYYTATGTNNQYAHVLAGIDASFQTSGVFLPAGTEVNQSYVMSKLLLGGNLGMGVDVGFTYHPEKQWTVSGSILDFGFINNKQNNRTYEVQGNYQFEGVEPNFNPLMPEDYWQNLKDDFEAAVGYRQTTDSYFSWRSTKVNVMAKYEFGEDRLTDCLDTDVEAGYFNAIGAHFFTVFRPVAPQMAATIFYERKFNKSLRAKFTYTADSYSFSNIGMGISAKIGIFNIYGMMDNLLGYQNLAKSNGTSFQLGMNIIVP